MKESRVIELNGESVVAEDVERRIKTAGIRGLDFQKAKELGFFNRISNLLCAAHASIMAAYRIYGGVDYLLSEFGGRKNEIAKQMNDFERSVDKFIRFWTDYYAHGQAGKEVNEETETLYRHIMEWAQLPYEWNLGDAQRVEDKGTDVAIRMVVDDKTLTFRTTTVNDEIVGSGDESWCVSKYDLKTHKQTIVEDNMDKPSAMMVAKRMSDDDKENVYTACALLETMERKTVVTPYRAYRDNQTVGRITKQFK